MLRGTTLVRLGRLEEGLPLLERAAADGASAHHAVRAEAGYDLALAYFTANRLDDAVTALDTYADPGADIIHARALELYGWIEVRRERYPIAARHFLDALEVLRSTTHRDALMVASLLHGMTGIALDTLDLKLFARVRRRHRRDDVVAWLADALVRDPPRPRVRRAAGRQRGRSVAVSRRDAVRVGRGRAARRRAGHRGPHRARGRRHVHAGAPGAQGRRGRGRRRLGRDRRRGPRRAARAGPRRRGDRYRDRRRAWRRCTRRCPRRARRSTCSTCSRGSTRSRTSRAPRSPARRGETGEALKRLRSAVAVWRRLGDRYDEAVALLALAEIAPGDDALTRADELTRVVPRSWLRRRYAALAERARGVEQLSKAEHRVMLAICEGRSTAEIADRFGRSKNTIRNQTRRVYEVMGVRTRSALGLEVRGDGHRRRSRELVR